MSNVPEATELLDAASRFRLYYRSNFWGDAETASGDSSRLDKSEAISLLLQKLVFPLGIQLLDLGCGDCNWIGELTFKPSRYVGVDLVPELIERNRARFRSDSTEFYCHDMRQPLPVSTADVVLIRDIFPHMSDDEVQTVIGNIRSLSASVLIANTFRGAPADRDMSLINHRSVDLESERFGLGPATFFLPEEPSSVFDQERRGLGIWELAPDSRVARDLRRSASTLAEVDITSTTKRPAARLAPGSAPARSEVDPHDLSLVVDGRGFAYPAPNPTERDDPADAVHMTPLYVPVSHTERRLTKRVYQTPDGGQVLGASCVARVQHDPLGILTEGSLALVVPTIDDASGMVSYGVSEGDGYLRSSAHIDRQAIKPLGVHKVHHNHEYRWLLSVPLSAVLDACSQLETLGLSGQAPSVHIWGGGTIGLLLAWRLSHLGWTVTVSDVYAPDSWLAETIKTVGATYVGPDFDYVPKTVVDVGIDASTDCVAPPSLRAHSTAKALLRITEMDRAGSWPEATSRLQNPTFSSPAYADQWIEESIALVASTDEAFWSHFISQVCPFEDYDQALFPMAPTRMHIVKLPTF